MEKIKQDKKSAVELKKRQSRFKKALKIQCIETNDYYRNSDIDEYLKNAPIWFVNMVE